MRWKIPAGVLMALALLIPAAPAVAQAGPPGLNQDCQTVDRKIYTDMRVLFDIDLDHATDTDVLVRANQILSAARADALATLPDRVQERLDGTVDDLRAFLRTDAQTVWTVDLRIAVNRTMTDAGPNVKAAAQTALDDGSIDAMLTYLNDGLYVARALDCASPSPSASASAPPSPSAPASASVSPGPASASASASAAGTLPTTGPNTSFLALGGVALTLFGIGFVLLARRFRT